MAVLAVWLWALLASSQLGRAVHFALEPHGQCEHGRLVHAIHADQPSPPQQPRGLRPESHGEGSGARQPLLPSTVDVGEAAGRHVHCDFIGTTAGVETDGPPPVAPTVIAWVLPVERLVPSFADSPIDLLLLAPKSSPPTG